MNQSAQLLFGPEGFMPHGHCFLWSPGILWLHVLSDTVIALAYFSIPLMLLHLLSKRRDIAFSWIFGAFGIFILACGATHLLEIWTIWHPAYWLAGLAKAVTALASIVTAVLLVRLMPRILTLPSPQQLRQLNDDLRARNEELNQINQRLSETRSQLVESEKMASLGQLAAGVAHEINNPIGYVASNFRSLDQYRKAYDDLLHAYAAFDQPTGQEELQRAEIARLKADMDFYFLQEDMPSLLDGCADGLARVQKIVADLKDFSQPEMYSTWVEADLHAGLESTLSIAASEIKGKAELIRDYGTLEPVQCLPAQINQVFLNVLVNAAHAIEGRGTITIATRQEAGMALVRISDSGIGIPPHNLARIFEPFFTTREVGSGTGLGLSLSYGVIKKHNGSIEVDSTPGVGSTFTIRLPLRQPGACA